VRSQRWYELRPAPFAGSFADASNLFRDLFDDSVRLRLRADVAVGTCLSGGLDSSSIACTVRQQLGAAALGRQNTFSAYSDVPRFDERRFIVDVVNAIGASPHDVTPSPDELVATLNQLTCIKTNLLVPPAFGRSGVCSSSPAKQECP